MAYERKDSRTRPAATSTAQALPWLALAVSVAAAAAALTTALIMAGRTDRLRGEKTALEKRAAALEVSGAELAGRLEKLSGRLATAEARCRTLEAQIPGQAELRRLAARAARAELARRRAGGPGGDPQRAAEAIAAIREKVEKKQMKPAEGREAIAEKIQEGLKEVLPAEAVEKIKKARAEREKNMTEEEKKRAGETRAAVLDGIADWVTIQKKVKDGEITQEEARKALREKWRKHMETFKKNLPEEQRKKLEERMKARRERREGREPEPLEQF